MKNKAFVASLCIILVMVSFIFAIMLAAGSTTAQTSLSLNGAVANPRQPYSYIVYTNGTNYFMENGTTGQIDFQSTNASAVINNAIGNSSTINGSVCFTAGTFYTEPFNISQNVNVYGQGAGITTITLSAVPSTTYFIGTSLNTGHISLHDLTINGQGYHSNVGAEVDGLQMSTWESRFWNLEILNCTGNGFSLGNVNVNTYPSTNYISETRIDTIGNNGLYIQSIDSTHVSDNEISECNASGIFIDNSSPDNYLVENHIWSVGSSGIKILSRSQTLTSDFVENSAGNGYTISAGGSDTTDVAETVLTNCRAGVSGSTMSKTYDGFHIDGIPTHIVRQVQLIGCVSDNYPGITNQRYGIYIGQYTDGIQVEGGVVAYNDQYGLLLNNSNNHRISNVEFRNNGVVGDGAGGGQDAIYCNVSNGDLISGCTIASSAGWGIRFSGICDKNRVEENSINSTNWTGLGWETATTGSVISCNTVNSTGYVGIEVVGGCDCTIQGNTIGNTGSYGIYLSGGAGNTLTGNTVSFAQGTKDGICLAGSNNNIMEANIIHDNTRYGINIGAGSNNTIQGNRLYSDSSGEINNTGTGTAVHNNVGFVTEYYSSAINATATTWTFTPAMGNGGGSAPSPTYVWASFNSTQVTAYKWSYLGTTLTITAQNSATSDQIVACYVQAIYQP